MEYKIFISGNDAPSPPFCWIHFSHVVNHFVLIDMPSLSGVSDMDYPLQGPGLLSVPNLPELNAVRRVPLPPELVEQFSRILSSHSR